MLRELASFAGEAAHETMQHMMRQAARMAVLIGVALMLAGSAVLFGEVALYFYLRRFASPQTAALIVAGSALLLLVILLLGVWIGGATGGNRRRSPAPAARPQMAAATGEPAAASGRTTSDTAQIAAQAEAIGALLGRDLKGYPLVLTAMAVGLLLGRARN